jgi:hypothetical protein
MKKILLVIAIAGLAAAIWFRTARSADGLIDIQVSSAPLAEVIQTLERKSGRTIVAPKSMDARITLSLRQQALETILARVAEQANAVAILALPVYSEESSLQELVRWFETSGSVSRWSESTNLFTGDRRMLFFRDPREPEPLVSISVTNVAAPDTASLISQAAGAHVLLEDKTKGSVSLALKDQPVTQAAEAFASRLGKKSAELYLLQPKPKQLALISAGQKEVRESSGNSERIVRRQAGPGDRERLEKLAAMSPDERKAFLQEDLNNKAAARMLDRLRNQSPEQRVDNLRDGGREEEIRIRN